MSILKYFTESGEVKTGCMLTYDGEPVASIDFIEGDLGVLDDEGLKVYSLRYVNEERFRVYKLVLEEIG